MNPFSQLTWGQVTTFVGALLALAIAVADVWFFNHALGADSDRLLLGAGLGALLGTVGGRSPVVPIGAGRTPQ